MDFLDYKKQELIDEMNEFNSIIEPANGFECKKCGNKGKYLTLDSHNLQLIYNICDCYKIRHNIQSSGLVNMLEKYTIDKYLITSKGLENASNEIRTKVLNGRKYAKQKAIEFMDNPKGWFYIGGVAGSGKTHLCTAICNKLMQDYKQVEYLIWDEKIPYLNSIIVDNDKKSLFYEQMNIYKTCEVLYIDDFFKPIKNEYPTAGEIKRAKEILSERYINNLITIISSERDFASLENVDMAICGRIREMSGKNSIMLMSPEFDARKYNF